jgi:hypothetical protein
MHKHNTWSLVILSVLSLVLTACAPRSFSDKTVVEWSRGRTVGVSSQSAPAALAVTPDGKRIALAWVVKPKPGIETLHLLVMDDGGTVLSDTDLPLKSVETREPRLVFGTDGQLNLTWTHRSEEVESLHYAQVLPNGQLVSSLQQLSSPGFRVNGHGMAALPSGDLLVVWSTRLGLTAARITADGQVQRSAVLEAPDSFQLDLRVDDVGLAHIAWQQSLAVAERRLMSTTLDPSTLTFSWPMYLTTVMLHGSSGLGGSSEVLKGPAIALVAEQVLVTWAVGQVRGSNDDAFYASFVPGEAKEVLPRRITVPSSYQPDYSEASGSLPYRQLAPPLPATAVAHRTFALTAPATVAGSAEKEVPLAVSLWLRTSWGAQLQPALVIIDGGKVRGFQVVGWSRYPSLHPSLAADADGNLYLAWADAAGKTFPIYLASTAASLQATWDTPTRDDLRVALERWFGRLLSAFGLVLLVVSWLFLPGLVLIITLFLFREDSLETARGRMVLFLMIGLYWTGKYLFTSNILTSLPRMSDWPLIFPLLPLLAPATFAYLANQLQLPAFIAPLMPYLVPGLTLILSAIVTRLLYLNRSKYPNLVPAFLILAAVDLFLSLQIYALAYYDPAKF